MIDIGIKGHLVQSVTDELCADRICSGLVKVFATPMMIALIKRTCNESVVPLLDAGQGTVGTRQGHRGRSRSAAGNGRSFPQRQPRHYGLLPNEKHPGRHRYARIHIQTRRHQKSQRQRIATFTTHKKALQRSRSAFFIFIRRITDTHTINQMKITLICYIFNYVR